MESIHQILGSVAEPSRIRPRAPALSSVRLATHNVGALANVTLRIEYASHAVCVDLSNHNK